MKLTVELNVDRHWNKEQRNIAAKRWFDTIKTFATMTNHAFWSDSDEHKNCIIVRGDCGDLEAGRFIETKKLDEEILHWCEAVIYWCSSWIDENENDEEDAWKCLSVEIEDLVTYGGLSIKSYDEGNEPANSLYVLPIYNTEDD